MDVKCCKCRKEYDLASNIFEYDKDTNCPILICPHCNFKHAINFMPFENKIEDFKKVKKLDLGNSYLVILGASRIANATRVPQSEANNADIKDGVAWDISTFMYAEKSKLISDQDTSPQGIAFNPDGTKMYITGSQHNKVYQYNLSTAWDVSTATYVLNKGVIDQDPIPGGIAFNPDGTKMFVMGLTNDTVYQYTLSSAWDVSTATYAEKSKLISDQDTSPQGIAFNPDGTKMYITGSQNDTVYQYTLSFAWDVSTATYAEKSAYIGNEDTYPADIAFNSDGTKMFVMGATNNTVFQYTLLTGWDVLTASYTSKFKSISSQDTSPRGIAFNSDGTKMFVMGSKNNTVYQYKLTFAWTKTDDFILATRIYTSKGPLARAYKLNWRDVTDEGVFAEIAATGEITYSATTDLTDDGDLLLAERICGTQPDYTWQNGLESEGDNLLPDTGTYSLADEYYTEFQWALDCNGAEDEHEYEFELWDVTEGVSIGTCLATITMAVVVAGLSMKWNGVAISKWNGVVIDKLNGVT